MLSKFTVFLFCLGSILSICHEVSAQNDWSRWRGPSGNGIAESKAAPLEWGSDENVIWKTKVPGRGHASPLIIDGKIFLTTAEQKDQTQSVICFDQKDGKTLWTTEVNRGGWPKRLHPKNTHATSTIATDGKSLFAVFSHHNNVHLIALDFDGRVLWKKDVGVYSPAYPFGYGSTPIVDGARVIVTNENKVKSAIVAYDTKTGDEVWRIDRAGVSSYSTPVVAEVAGRRQLLISGGGKVASYDPETGDSIWTTKANWGVTCGTMVWDENRVFASGGFPGGQTIGIDARNGEKLWDNPAKVYEQSMLAFGGFVFAHADNGVLYCWRAADGNEIWKQKFSKRRVAVSASPVLVGRNLYFTAENGETVVIEAKSEGYQEIARNQLGDEAFASQVVCGGRLYTRVAVDSGGARQEWLYCLGER
ncbi:MAG: PQQ-binding-like beta-propeller repeat protein [Mariniblastus sp.]|nr:PQQ-binding-like beta-propeller repeat protein [Mariniblastus sp.]